MLRSMSELPGNFRNQSMVISTSIVTTDHEQATRAVEVLARAAMGLALDGISVSISIGMVDDRDTDL
jgi:hypothetical protein